MSWDSVFHVLGPTYRFSGEVIHDAIVYIDDHHWDEHSQKFHVADLLARNPGNHLLVFDHLAHDDQLAHLPHVCLPVYLAAETEQFIAAGIVPDWNHKRYCFNFMINKPRPHREWLLRMVDQHGLTSWRHSLPWRQSPCASIPVTDYRFGPEQRLDRGIRNGAYLNCQTYQGLLQTAVFEPTCVSVITEPCWQEREVMITEKTVMAIYAGTLPLWVGGWRLPDVMRELGFDVFDDVMDHGYSTLADPEQRMQQAVSRNLHLLTDFDTVHDFVQANQHRLAENLALLETNPFLALVQKELGLRPGLRPIAERWGLRV